MGCQHNSVPHFLSISPTPWEFLPPPTPPACNNRDINGRVCGRAASQRDVDLAAGAAERERMISTTLLCFLLLRWGHSTHGDSGTFRHPGKWDLLRFLAPTPHLDPSTIGKSRTPSGCVKAGSVRLTCSNLNLTSIPTGLDPRLRKLDVSQNQITDMGVLDQGSLLELDASRNRLRLVHERAFEGVTGLRVLIVGRNVLGEEAVDSSRAFRALRGLRTLDLSYNGLDHHSAGLYLSKMPTLDHLTLAGNSLTKLSPELFTGTQNLRNISIENNLIQDIEEGTFEPLHRLAWLNLAHNNLRCVCDFKLRGLRILNLSRNSIEFFISGPNNDIHQLEMLDLSYNNLLYFPVLPKNNRLKYLHLQNNKLGNLAPERSISEVSSLYEELIHSKAPSKEDEYNIYSNWRLMPLTHLDLSNNQFTSFPFKTLRYLPTLESLNMSSNCLLEFGSDIAQKNETYPEPWRPEPLPSLRSLDLQRNQIRSLGFTEALPKIEMLNLQRNQVKPCKGNQSESTWPRLNITDTDDNAPCTSFQGVRTLKHLNLGENSIETLFPHMFQSTPLVSLNLAGNRALTMVGEAFTGLQDTLESLSFSGNRMRDSDLPLGCLKALRRLDLAGNLLEHLPMAVGCSPLRELDLRDNRFSSLNGQPLTCLDMVLISGNAFNCCTADRWLETLRQARVHVPDLSQAICLYNLNGSRSSQPLGNHSQLCPPEPNTKTNGPKLLAPLVILLIGFLSLILLLLLVKGVACRRCSSLSLKSNKVASVQYCNNMKSAAQVAKINISSLQ
ncbi:hypothetical protein AGOR_G00070130 [Albula goreensis]|uniref:Uncharacterized protein n=1 Tax=Albula goreensis TaxID=1534307 RepID=A0A8T3DLX2_9TELE|nr:hypothetical protein AGOR_G00070130 [Albula goreensis]